MACGCPAPACKSGSYLECKRCDFLCYNKDASVRLVLLHVFSKPGQPRKGRVSVASSVLASLHPSARVFLAYCLMAGTPMLVPAGKKTIIFSFGSVTKATDTVICASDTAPVSWAVNCLCGHRGSSHRTGMRQSYVHMMERRASLFCCGGCI